ncbi:ABC-type transport auxiliary lipoprotein family protein [Pelagibius sp. Alg239-R121]|uniref:ABC-type transport auxiliary lipoprotein family protein n=1 Tax=Pelagibius sp. Alg239-R121 TaxID=2993448 RepID=UPI0024A6ECE4|nr:ABC-type transport auxiliary lipoprotein family protein [Pelagibius sp. Alg239-R121]
MTHNKNKDVSNGSPDSELASEGPAIPQRRQSLKALAALPIAGFAAACSNIVPGQGPPPALYRLTPKSTFREDLPTVEWQLVLEPPLANGSLNTTRIALQRSPTQMEFYARSGWVDQAPIMVQTLMVESFENSGKIVSVARETGGLRADFIIKTELREFQTIYYRSGRPEALVAINAKLIQLPQRTIIASQNFKHAAPAAADQIDDIVVAFDDALDKVLRGLVEWTLLSGQAAFEKNGRRRRQPRPRQPSS